VLIQVLTSQQRLPHLLHLQWPQRLHQLQPNQVPHPLHQAHQRPQKNPDFSLNSTG
jgi:hypothetical protein